ncbi:MAG: hypothetical protein LBN32_00755 [Helicobacteraceae bacterium]|nr:hypothetical protein [Helicobacteraceae bacterium]
MSIQELNQIKELLSRVQVAHHIPGRVRLKLRGKPPEWLLRRPFETEGHIKRLFGVQSVCVNPFGVSAVIAYDKSVLSPSLFESLAKGDIQPLLDYSRRLR